MPRDKRRSPALRTLTASVGWAALPSVHGAPVAAVAGHQPAGDEENQVHKPPDAQASQSQQLPHGGPGVAQAESIHSKASQEKRVEQSGYEVVSSVPATAAGGVRGGPGSVPPARTRRRRRDSLRRGPGAVQAREGSGGSRPT